MLSDQTQADANEKDMTSFVTEPPLGQSGFVSATTNESPLHSSVMEITNPSTPPRAHTTDSVPTLASQSKTERTTPRSRNKRHGSENMQNATQSAGPKPFQNQTLSPAIPNASLTPSRPYTTPSKAYAGPTFHASPAASCLPLPKLFSKSVPNVNKTTSISNLVGQDTAENTASESEGSPFVDELDAMIDHPSREQSPLDVFFQADRREKAARLGSLTPEYHMHKSTIGREASASPSRSRPDLRNHSRHPTDSSIGGVFSLELDGATSDSPRLSPQPGPKSGDSVPMHSTKEGSDEERRQAQSAALKRMLFSPPAPQENSPIQPKPVYQGQDAATPSPSSHKFGSPTRTPSRSPGLASDASRAQRHAALLALAQKQIPSSTGHTGYRPPSSHLRKEMIVPQSPTRNEVANQPAVQTNSLPNNVDSRPFSYSKSSGTALNSIDLKATESSPKTPKMKSNPKRPSSNTKTIEDDLRRILKLDVLGGNDDAGVPS